MPQSRGPGSPPPLTVGIVDTRHVYHQLFGIYVPIAAGVFVVIVVLVGFAVLRYRGRPPSAAARWHEHNLLEGGYALALTCVVAFLLYLTYSAEHQVDTVSARERPSLTIDVIASKWEWTFRYPASGITERSGEVGHQPLVVPTGEAIRFRLSSVDVIHAFWIPQLDFKRDAFPGTVQDVTLSFANPGVFPAQCAEFCGVRHAEMTFTVRAVSPAQFRAWSRHGGAGQSP